MEKPCGRLGPRMAVFDFAVLRRELAPQELVG